MDIRYLKSRLISEISDDIKSFIYTKWKLIQQTKKKIFPQKYHPAEYRNNDLIYINPKSVKMAVKKEFDIFKYKGRVISGNWDKDTESFENFDFYKSFNRIIDEVVNWEDTEFYRRVLKEIQNGRVKWGCRNREDLDRRCEKLMDLYESIRDEGYRESSWNEDEITVNIARDGEILFNNGRHRLTFCKKLGIERIPAKVTVRHRKWDEFVNEILDYVRKHNNKVYTPLLHPDLEHIPSNYDQTRFELIRDNLGRKKGRLLDIGGHWGYFCAKFEEVGFDCYCVEKSVVNLHFLKRLKDIYRKDFKIIEGSIFSVFSELPEKFDVILALSVFHHFLKSREVFNKLKNLLKQLHSKEMFIEAYNFDEDQLKNAYKRFTLNQFVDFILEYSNFSEFERIGFSDNGRPIYRFYNE